MKKYCSNCQAWKESWADNPSYRSSSTYRRYERCWSCDEWTLSDRTIFIPRSSIVNRDRVYQGLDNVRAGRARRFVCGSGRNNSGEFVQETLIYDGGGTYTRIIERDGRQTTETRELQTFMEVFFLEIMEAVVENPQLLLCKIS